MRTFLSRLAVVLVLLWPLAAFNVVFDVFLLPWGPIGRWLRGAAGRNLLAVVGLLCLAAAAALALADWYGWTPPDWFGWTR